ncbi:MAG: bifunctional sugar-1-phosphate nucleotidylyltransferase/acetyltransferase [Candidatus Micrarchaeota archaeon]
MKLENFKKLDYVLLAAGNGKRLWPITEHEPKTMVRILEKPLLEWMVENVAPHAGKIIVIVGSHKEKILDHFKGTKYAPQLEFVEQKELSGTGRATLLAEDFVTSEKFAVFNADTFCDPKLYTLIAAESAAGEFIVGRKVADGSKYGVLTKKDGNLEKIVEKPSVAPNALINTGTYCVSKTFFKFLKELKLSPRGEYEVTDALTAYSQKYDLKVLSFDGYWNDVGYFWNYLDTNDYALKNLMKEKNEGTIEKSVVVNGKISVGKGAIIRGPCRIDGNVYLGENCEVGPNALMKDCVLEKDCRVGSSEVKRSIIMSNSKALHFNHVVDCVIGENVNFGAGSQSSNVRFDRKSIKVTVNGKILDSGRIKLGSAIGNNTEIGCNVVIYPGKLIGGKCTIYPGVRVEENVESGTVVER